MAPYGQFVELIIKNTGLFQQHNTGMSQAMNDSIVLHIGGDAVHICVTPSELLDVLHFRSFNFHWLGADSNMTNQLALHCVSQLSALFKCLSTVYHLHCI